MSGGGSIGSVGSVWGLRRRPMFPPPEKAFLEDFYIRRRETQARTNEYWSQTSTYFSKAEADSKKWDRLEICSQVAEKTFRESQRRESQKAHLLVRRERLKILLTAEAKAYEKELQSLATVPTRGNYRDEREVLRTKREEESRENARIKMEQHWKINNPEFRELSMRKHRDIVHEAWKKQSQERQKAEEDKKQMEEASQRLMETRRLQQEEEFQKMEREKEKRIREWKSTLLDQSQALRDQRREEEELSFKISQELLKQNELRDLQEEIKKTEDTRQRKELSNFLRRQSRLKLRVRAQQIQDELNEDQRFLQRLQELEEKENGERESSRRKVLEDIQWMNQVLIDQKAEEKRREKELDILFSEEASKMWYRQEQIWTKEKEARERLLADVMQGIQEQSELKLRAKRKQKEEVQREQEELQREIESMESCISQEEARRKEKQVTYAQELHQQIQSRARSPPLSLDPQEQTLNQLSHRIGQLNIHPETSDISHFKRRKAKW